MSGREIAPPDTGRLITLALTMAAGRFLIRLMLPGVIVLNMHLGDFAQYVLLFIAGILAARNHWLPGLSRSAGKRWTLIVLPASFAGWLGILALSGVFRGGRYVPDQGWHWQSAALSIWESFACVALCFGLLALAREKFSTQGRLARFLSENAFSVYVFHPPFVIIGARLFHSLAWSPLSKFVTLTVLSALSTFIASAMVFRRIPILRAIL